MALFEPQLQPSSRAGVGPAHRGYGRNRMATKPRGMAFRVVRAAVIAVLVVLLVPYLLAPLYRVIDPVSTLMLWRRVTGERVERVWVPLTAIAPILPRTVMAA